MADKNQALLPAYLVVGPDELRRKQVLARLRTHVEGPYEAFNLEEVTPTSDLDPATLLSSLNTLPMGAASRIVILEPADKLAKVVSEALVQYLADPNPNCTLALVATTLAKTTRLYKAVAKFGSKAIISCMTKKGKDLPPYVQRLAANHGISMGADAALELIARVGDSTTMLDRQLATLCDLVGGSGVVTRDFVEAHVARVVEVKPWEFLDRLSERDATRSLELLRLLDGSSLGLLSLITTRIRELICARSLATRGAQQTLAEALSKQAWQVKNHTRWSRNFSEGELERLLVCCAETEASMKSGGDQNTELVRLVTRICGV